VSKLNVLQWLLVVLRRQSPSLPSNHSVKTQELDLGSCKLLDLDVMQIYLLLMNVEGFLTGGRLSSCLCKRREQQNKCKTTSERLSPCSLIGVLGIKVWLSKGRSHSIHKLWLFFRVFT
jgi:hypothetical protein